MNAVTYHSGIAQAFDERYKQSPDFQERYRVWAALLDQYVRPGDRVLDAGCGPGVFSLYAAQRGATVTAIDASNAMIDLTRQAARQAQLTICAEIDWLPLTHDRGCFDLILSSSVLEYVPNLPGTLVSLDRQVAAGGLLIVSMPNRRSVYRCLERIGYWFTGRPVYLRHVLHYATPARLHRQLPGYQLIFHQTYGGTNACARLLRSCLPALHSDTLFVAVFRKQ
ncbi:3-demethylubiquinone-9 3-methyltransferase [Fibrella aestuarina BUZ 2]|uniref:3-demethylubiquinone-9 3-methyltransferase n=1 Tax=Fibrella aestuarina BUZ 2 TaxID=1166018 RepID=I0K649_9BACT|nr:methyltransferase domain-containing protein [Fibrella aestuarina]CCG99602.1 3-demethylubiquinone-9 3-methyltransferase [Fibrella aestuarina BUZ 2]